MFSRADRANEPLRPDLSGPWDIRIPTLMPTPHVKPVRPAIRVPRDKANHHLWNNNGTWWCRYTVLYENGKTMRHHRSLKTRDLEKARGERDRFLRSLIRASANSAS
jgi:hypothetical protein